MVLTLNRIFQFLDLSINRLPTLHSSRIAFYFSESITHSRMSKMVEAAKKNQNRKDQFQMWPKTRHLLHHFYFKNNQELAFMLNDKRYLEWNKITIDKTENS